MPRGVKGSGPTLFQRSRRVPPIVKATAHQVSGAGKSRVKRQFFGLSESDERWLETEIDHRIDLNIHRDG